jgi:hypothetical protein
MTGPVTSVFERLNDEIKRRADVVGIFPNEAAIRRLAGALLLEQNDEYAIQKRYMSLESLAAMSENPQSGCRQRRCWPDVGKQSERKNRRQAQRFPTPRLGTQPYSAA